MKVSALLSMHLWVDCPHCTKQIDLFDTYENEEGYFYNLVFSNRYVHDQDRWEDINMEVECEHCKKGFILDKIDW